jgi:Rod binding domain-containing protein
MSYAALATAQVAHLAPQAAPPPATPAQMARIRHTAKDFESQLIGQMLKPMFDGLATDGEFDGGEAEGTYRSFMVDAMGKQMARSGGIGVAQAVEREMLKMQGLSDPATVQAAAA